MFELKRQLKNSSVEDCSMPSIRGHPADILHQSVSCHSQRKKPGYLLWVILAQVSLCPLLPDQIFKYNADELMVTRTTGLRETKRHLLFPHTSTETDLVLGRVKHWEVRTQPTIQERKSR